MLRRSRRQHPRSNQSYLVHPPVGLFPVQLWAKRKGYIAESPISDESTIKGEKGAERRRRIYPDEETVSWPWRRVGCNRSSSRRSKVWVASASCSRSSGRMCTSTIGRCSLRPKKSARAKPRRRARFRFRIDWRLCSRCAKPPAAGETIAGTAYVFDDEIGAHQVDQESSSCRCDATVGRNRRNVVQSWCRPR